MASRIFDQPTIPRLLTLIKELRTGSLLIPDFQRPFQWTDDHRLRLFDSISRGIPIGTLLVWQTAQHNLNTYPSLGGFPMPEPAEPPQVRRYVIDGHQRISTLFAALNWDTPSDQALRVWFDTRVTDGSLAFTSRSPKDGDPALVPLSILFNPRKLWEHQNILRSASMHNEADRAEALSNIFKDYQTPIVPLVSEDLDLVTSSFVRINEHIKPLHESHMLQALAYNKDRSVRQRLADLHDTLKTHGWGQLSEQHIINALKLHQRLDVYKSHPRELLKHIQDDTLDQLIEALLRAVEIMREHCGVHGPRSLPYTYQLLAFADVLNPQRGAPWPLNHDQHRTLTAWFWHTTYTNYFTGITGNRIRTAVDGLRDALFTNPDLDNPDRYPRFAEPFGAATRLDAYNYNATRSRAFALFLARHHAQHSGDPHAPRLLGQLGAQVVHKILPELPSNNPAARVVCSTEALHRLRNAIVSEDPYDPATFEPYMIRRDMLHALRANNIDAFLHARQLDLDTTELAFIKTFGINTDDAHSAYGLDPPQT